MTRMISIKNKDAESFSKLISQKKSIYSQKNGGCNKDNCKEGFAENYKIPLKPKVN